MDDMAWYFVSGVVSSPSSSIINHHQSSSSSSSSSIINHHRQSVSLNNLTTTRWMKKKIRGMRGFIVIGVTGCRKPTLVMEMAKRWEVIEADQHHSASNIEKMKLGIPSSRCWSVPIVTNSQPQDPIQPVSSPMDPFCSLLFWSQKTLPRDTIGRSRSSTESQVCISRSNSRNHWSEIKSSNRSLYESNVDP